MEVRGATAGQTLEVRVESVRVGPWGVTEAGGWQTDLNDRLGVSELEQWRLTGRSILTQSVGRDQLGRELDLRPFLGVMGMPPPEPGVHSTQPPRVWGGNIDCKELLAGTTLYLPIPVDGALSPPGTATPRQGDGEVSQLAIECPLERAELTLSVRDDLPLTTPIAWTPAAWLTFGFDEDLDEAAAVATDAMLELMGREHGFERRDALALASLVVDLRITQIVNRVKGVHAVLRHDAVENALMAYEFKLPDLGEGLTEGEVARWLVAEGQEIAEDDPLVEIQTDKATVEIPSPAAGVVSRILVAEGEVVPVGTVLVAIGGDA